MKWREAGISVGLLWLRVLAGAGLALHGYSKIFEMGVPKFAEGAVAPMGFPMPILFAWMAALTEFVGGVFLAAGLASRLTALAILVNMSVAAFMFHKGAALNVRELALAYWAAAGTILLTGPGKLSLDALVTGKKK